MKCTSTVNTYPGQHDAALLVGGHHQLHFVQGQVAPAREQRENRERTEREQRDNRERTERQQRDNRETTERQQRERTERENRETTERQQREISVFDRVNKYHTSYPM